MASVTDARLAAMIEQAAAMEAEARAAMATDDLAERDQAVNLLRMVVPVRRTVEKWITVRAMRAARADARG